MVETNLKIIDIIPHIINCTRELYSHTSDTSTEKWIFITNEVLYYLFPVILTIGVVFCIINTVITARMASGSNECYLTAFNLSCCFLLITVCLFQLPNYVRQSTNKYTYILPYLPAVESWFWYSCTWLLVTIVVERTGHSLCGTWHSSFGRIHGVLVSILITITCFVSGLPQYWEYKHIQINVFDGVHNCSRDVLTPRPDVLKVDRSGYISEYSWYHWFELVVSIALPYLILPMLILPLVCIKTHIYTSMPLSMGKNSSKYSAANVKDQLREERSFNRLIFTLTVLYLVMSGPRNVVRLLHNPLVGVTMSNNDLLISTLVVLFDVLFYLFFSSLFFIYLMFGKKFRTTLYQLCCCKKYDDIYDYY